MKASIFFGSVEEARKGHKIVNKYTKKVVSEYPVCTPEDAIRALKIAQKGAENQKNQHFRKESNGLKMLR